MARALYDLTGQRQILLDRLPTITAPTLIVWGETDYVLPAHHARTAVDLHPHGQLALLPDCGHLPHIEHPEHFTAVLNDWLTELHAPPAHQPSDTEPAGLAAADLRVRPTEARSRSDTA